MKKIFLILLVLFLSGCYTTAYIPNSERYYTSRTVVKSGTVTKVVENYTPNTTIYVEREPIYYHRPLLFLDVFDVILTTDRIFNYHNYYRHYRYNSRHYNNHHRHYNHHRRR